MTIRHDHARLDFHRLRFLAEGDEVVVGRVDTGSYAILPADGAALLRELVAGRSPAAAARWYARTFGEPVDIDEFLDTVSELGFLYEGSGPAPEQRPVRWQRAGRALFSAPAWICYAALFAAAIGALCADPRLLPTRHHVIFTHYLLVVEVVLFFGQLPLTLLHEAFHVLAGRRLGLPTRLTIGRRFYMVVFETAIDGLVVVPKRQRYLPMLAGMLADLLGIAVLTVVAYATRSPGGEPILIGRVCLALAFTSVARFAWQFYFFLRTDIYHLVANLLGCVDLHTVSGQLLRNRFHRLLGRPDRLVDESRWHPRDRRVARFYAPLHALGYTFATVMFVVVMIPLSWRFISGAVHTLCSPTAPLASVADAAVLLTLNLGQVAAALVIAIRDRRRGPAADRKEIS
ncbi:hypothetical protein [Nocardia aurantia]|uniref:PqqD family protein n=1 Tax=Nocardia aurantia TaxID=2585199 RepID=A0A7K0DJM8_9NOCA|nr:hypothetical protein [Nocardia aurantia]MQY26015.1 hypothetical protein [Nocardia aurantia]